MVLLGFRQAGHGRAQQHQQIQEHGGEMAAVGGQRHDAEAQAQAGTNQLGAQHLWGKQAFQRVEQVAGQADQQRRGQGQPGEHAAAERHGFLGIKTAATIGQDQQADNLYRRNDTQPDQQGRVGDRGKPVSPHQGNGGCTFQQQQGGDAA